MPHNVAVHVQVSTLNFCSVLVFTRIARSPTPSLSREREQKVDSLIRNKRASEHQLRPPRRYLTRKCTVFRMKTPYCEVLHLRIHFKRNDGIGLQKILGEGGGSFGGVSSSTAPRCRGGLWREAEQLIAQQLLQWRGGRGACKSKAHTHNRGGAIERAREGREERERSWKEFGCSSCSISAFPLLPLLPYALSPE